MSTMRRMKSALASPRRLSSSVILFRRRRCAGRKVKPWLLLESSLAPGKERKTNSQILSSLGNIADLQTTLIYKKNPETYNQTHSCLV